MSQNSLDRFARSMGQVQSIIDPDMKGLGPGGFSDMDDLAVIPFHGRGDAHMHRQSFPDHRPAIGNPLLPELEANGMEHMVGQDRDKEMPVCPVLVLMINGAQSQVRFHASEGIFDVGEHAEDVE